MNARLLALLIALSLPLAGCLDDAAQDPAEGADPLSGNVTDGNETAVDEGSPLDDAAPTGDNATDPGARAHKHDYWGDAMEKVLVDATFEPSMCLRTDSVGGSMDVGCIYVRLGNGSVVFQGTSRMTVLATWNDPKVSGLKMFYRDALATHEEPVDLVSGTPFEIPVDAATADIPHSKESQWGFDFRGSGAVVGTAMAPVHITITIYRGLDLPLDPPHPDFWGDKTELDLGGVSGVLTKPEDKLLDGWDEDNYIRLPEGAIIPAGTATLTIHYTWKIVDPASGVSYYVYPSVKTAKNQYGYWAYEVEDDQNQKMGTLRMAVEPDMTDSPYAKESQWGLFLHQNYREANSQMWLPVFNGLGADPFSRDIEYTAHFIVSKIPDPSLVPENWDDEDDDDDSA